MLPSIFQSSSHERASRLQISATPKAEVSGEERKQVWLRDSAVDIAWRWSVESATWSPAAIGTTHASSVDVARGLEDPTLLPTVSLPALSAAAQARR